MTEEMRVISAFGKGIDALSQIRHYNGIFGISADYPFFQKTPICDYLDEYLESKKLRSYIKWSLDFFDKLLIFTPDWILHYNLMAFEGMDRERALETVRRTGEITQDKCNRIISDFKTDRITFFRWSSENSSAGLEETIEKVRDFSRLDNRFFQDCLDLTLSATHNKLELIRKIHGKKQYKESVSIAQKYAVDDIALTLYLYKSWGPVSISKYELPIPMKNFLYGKYPELCRLLELGHQEIGHVQVVAEKEMIHNKLYDDRYERLEAGK